MNLWSKIKKFFSGEKNGEELEKNDKGELEITVEMVGASDDDLSVELFEVSENSNLSPEEDPDIEVEIVDSDEEDTSALSELNPVDMPMEQNLRESDSLFRENTENCGEKAPECPSRMTDEYKQWLKEQEVWRNQSDNSIES